METILLVKVICTKGYAQSDGTIGWKISMYKFMEKGAPIGQIRGPQECRETGAIRMETTMARERELY